MPTAHGSGVVRALLIVLVRIAGAVHIHLHRCARGDQTLARIQMMSAMAPKARTTMVRIRSIDMNVE